VDIRPGIGRLTSMIGSPKTFKEVDDSTGSVTKRNFKLSASDRIEVQVQRTPADPGAGEL
jgi:hypothetical protein